MINIEIYKKLINEFKKPKIVFPIYEKEIMNININIENEKWKKIKGFNYSISNYGRIKNNTTNNIKALRHGKYGFQINLWNKGTAKMFTISRLVANYFIRELKDNEIVFHKNKKIYDNYYKNLKIVTR